MYGINQLESEKYSTVLYKEKAILDNVIKLKIKLKELIRNEADIENIIKDLSDDEIFLSLKFWELIKREFLKIYGFNNKQIKSSEIADFIINILEDQSKNKYEKKTNYSLSTFEPRSDLTVAASRLTPIKDEPNLQALRMRTPMEKSIS